MKTRIVRLLGVIAVLAMTLAMAGCANDSADAKKAVQDQITGLESSYGAAIDEAAADESFSDFASIGIDPATYVEGVTKATQVEVGDVSAEESAATATVTVAHPDIDALVKLMDGKAKEFEASDDYADFGQEERFARSQELLNEAIVGCDTAESTLELKLSKTDDGWTLDEDLATGIVGSLIEPDQTKALSAAMKPFSWKYDGMNASQVAEAMKASGLPIGDIQAFDETSDPNGLLGRPGEYTSKAHFLDTRVHDEYGFEWFEGEINTDYGGTIEVFDTLADAKKRSDYLQGLMDTGASFNKMYQYRKGTVLLRVGFELTPSQAAEYEKEFYQKSE